MDYISILITVSLWLGLVHSHCHITDHERQNVPSIYAADSFPKCKKSGNLFCRLHVSLEPQNNGSDSWKIIQKSNSHTHCFNRNVVYRFRCLSSILKDEREMQTTAIENENNLLKNYSLRGHLDVLKCSNYSKIDILTLFDYIVMLALVGYMTTIFLATYADYSRTHEENVKRGDNFLSNFSLRRQWNDLRKPINDPEYNKLKCLQGVRTYTMAFVITGHTLSSALFSYVKDEKYIENFYVDLTTKAVVNGGLLLVQINFMLSGFLSAKMIYNEVDKSGEVKFQFIVKKIAMRYVRLFPTLAFIICLEMSNWTKVLVAPPPLESFDLDHAACQKNWWASILLINNIFISTDMCNMGLWYLTNDFQMYIISLMMFYLMFKYDIGPKMIIWVMAFFWSVTFCLIYSYNMAVSYPYYASSYQYGYSMASYEMYVLYTSLYINYGSYGVGLIFGYLYHRYRNQTFASNMFVSGIWLLLFIGLPAVSIYGTLFEYSRLTSALLGPTLKPLFASGVAIGLFGMIHGLGGIIKKMCEWDYAEFVARWSYSTYLIHFFIVFGRHLLKEGLEEISHEIMFTSAVSDIIQSFIAGLVLHLTIERPMAYVFMGVLSKKKPQRS
nr:O-acyltransferase like protein-like [Leptinotarsa decemlineata]